MSAGTRAGLTLGRLAAAAAVAALAVGGAGCGGGEDDEGTPDAQAPTSVAEAPDESSQQPNEDRGGDDSSPPGAQADVPTTDEAEKPKLPARVRRIVKLAQRQGLARTVRERIADELRAGEDPLKALKKLRRRYGDAIKQLQAGKGGDGRDQGSWGSFGEDVEAFGNGGD